jgi:hypothetical protein
VVIVAVLPMISEKMTTSVEWLGPLQYLQQLCKEYETKGTIDCTILCSMWSSQGGYRPYLECDGKNAFPWKPRAISC